MNDECGGQPGCDSLSERKCGACANHHQSRASLGQPKTKKIAKTAGTMCRVLSCLAMRSLRSRSRCSSLTFFPLPTLLLYLPQAPRLIVAQLGSATFLFQLLSYVLSFSIIGIYWQRHHWIFRHIIKADGGLLWLNLTLLLFIVFLPFPTNLLGRYGGTSVVVALYAGVLVMLSAVQLLLWEYATIHHRLVRPSLEQNTIVYLRMRMLSRSPSLPSR